MMIKALSRLAILLLVSMLVTACGGDDVANPQPGDLTEEGGDPNPPPDGSGGSDTDIWSDVGISLDDLILNAPSDSESGFVGFVYQRDQWCYGRIPDAKILIVSEDGRNGYLLTADSRGEYTLRVRPGGYKAFAVADGYEPFVMCNGYMICREGQFQQSNIPLVPVGPVCGGDGRYYGTRGYNPDVWPDRAPTTTIEVEPEVVSVGQPVTVRVKGEDDHHIVWLSWSGMIGCQPNDGRAFVAACDGGPQCAGTWEVSFDTPGRYVLVANARDDLYPNGEPHTASSGLGAGCVEVIVTED